jgi:mannose-6-phosphate isomerase-like protein (cupin superfamily)
LAALACVAVLPALAQSEETGVPIFQAPFHVPAMKNEYGTVLIINVPPGRNTGYHIHDADSLSINIEAADMTNQTLGSSQVSPPNRAVQGRIAFMPYFKEGERTHKANNVGSTHFHNVSFVFASPRPSGFTPSTRGQGYEQIADNERFRAWRLALKPGESAAPYKQGAPGMRVIVSGGELTESVPGQPERGMKPRDGQFFWQEAGTTRTVRNTGTTPLNIVEIELK